MLNLGSQEMMVALIEEVFITDSFSYEFTLEKNGLYGENPCV